jgi:zinc transporter
MSGVIGSLEETIDDIEEHLEALDPHENQRKLSDLRKQIVTLRRYIAPQREALEILLMSAPTWLNVKERVEIREAADRLQRYVEALDAAKDRAIVIKDDIATRLIDKTNRTLYIISIISIIFLPLSFILELVGLNFAGMPSLGSNAFWIICALLTIVVVLEIFVLKKLKWF